MDLNIYMIRKFLLKYIVFISKHVTFLQNCKHDHICFASGSIYQLIYDKRKEPRYIYIYTYICR